MVALTLLAIWARMRRSTKSISNSRGDETPQIGRSGSNSAFDGDYRHICSFS